MGRGATCAAEVERQRLTVRGVVPKMAAISTWVTPKTRLIASNSESGALCETSRASFVSKCRTGTLPELAFVRTAGVHHVTLCVQWAYNSVKESSHESR
jgi:hypothetical protein